MPGTEDFATYTSTSNFELALDGRLIAAYVDSDPKYEGTEMRGVPVLAPKDVTLRDEAILSPSGTVHHEIARQIRENLGVGNEIMLLYEWLNLLVTSSR